MSSEILDSDDNVFSLEDILEIVPNAHRELGYGVLKESPLSGTGLGSTDRVGLKSLPEDICYDDAGITPNNVSLDKDCSSASLHRNVDFDTEAFVTNCQKSRKRKRKADKSTWAKQKQKMSRMRGESYVGMHREKSAETGSTKYSLIVPRQGRQIGLRCRSNYCGKRQSLKCDEFLENDRRGIFRMFWKEMDWDVKRSYVSSLVDTVPVKRRIKESKARRKDTQIYYLKLNERKVQVCRKMFLATLGLKKDQVLSWLKPCSNGTSKRPSSLRKARKMRDSTKSAHRFLDELPKLPSHYCRSSSSKLYFEPCINSKNQLYKLYKDYCTTNHIPACSRFLIHQLLFEKNISLFSPRKDQCDTCVSFEAGQITEKEWSTHRQKKDLARDQKKKDKIDADAGHCHVLTMDLQAVKLSPMLNASSLYYKTKLMVHNFTVHNLATLHGKCYWWDETEGDLVSSTFATCVTDYINENFKDKLPIIIYSDGCTSQNRNTMMSNALLDIAVKQNRIIIQKYLEKGHTQMECDSMHSAIEAELKNKTIHIPTDYLKISLDARTGFPYIVKMATHKFFKDFTMKKNQRYTSIRPGEKAGDPCVTDLRAIFYDPKGIIRYKLNHSDPNWQDLPQRPKLLQRVTFPALFHNRLKITPRKFKDLQALKHVIPKEFHKFYDNLPH